VRLRTGWGQLGVAVGIPRSFEALIIRSTYVTTTSRATDSRSFTMSFKKAELSR
jgi:hypothetical protein